MEIGIDSFAVAYDKSSRALDPPERLRNLIEQIEYADKVGLDVFGIGEHHRKDYRFSPGHPCGGGRGAIRAIELLGKRVAPALREELAQPNEVRIT